MDTLAEQGKAAGKGEANFNLERTVNEGGCTHWLYVPKEMIPLNFGSIRTEKSNYVNTLTNCIVKLGQLLGHKEQPYGISHFFYQVCLFCSVAVLVFFQLGCRAISRGL